MHEYSVVASLIELCEEHVIANQAKSVEKVVVVIGERSAMDKSLFISAFEAFREESACCKDAILEILDQKVSLQCKDCGLIFEPDDMDYGECKACQSHHLEMIKGKEMYLMRLELLGEEE